MRPFSRPLPKYDLEPMFVEPPDEVGLRKQAAFLIARTIRMADGEGFGLEDGTAIDDKWKIDWGQRIASGTYRQEVERLMEDIPTEYLAKVMLRAFYRAIMEMVEVGGDTLTCLMGIHALDGIVTDAAPQYDSLQLSFSKGDEVPEEMLGDTMDGDETEHGEGE